MAPENKENNKGCLIVALIAAVAFMIYSASRVSYGEFADLGEHIMTYVGVGIVILILKAFLSNSSKDNREEKVVSENTSQKTSNEKSSVLKTIIAIIGVLILAGVVISGVSSSTKFNHDVGLIVVAVIAIGGAVWFILNIFDD